LRDIGGDCQAAGMCLLREQMDEESDFFVEEDSRERHIVFTKIQVANQSTNVY
jgi:hypothetical protein